MPTRHRRSSSFRGSSHRRKLLWATSNESAAVGSDIGITPIDLLAGLEASGVGIVGGTVVRTHIALALNCLETDTAPGVFWGVLMYAKDQVAANKPPVGTDFYLDWAMQRLISPGLAPNAITQPTATSTLYGYEVDIKAKRMIKEMDDSYFFCLFNDGTQTVNYTLFAKTLVALP